MILFLLLIIISLNSSLQMNDSVSQFSNQGIGITEAISNEKEQNLDPFLMYAIAQVSAVFVAITAGLFTNKLISISGEKSRLKTKIIDFDKEINEHEIVLEETKTEIDRLKRKHAHFWAEHFVDSLESKSGLKKFTLAELKDEFDKSEYGPMDEYYDQVFDERYDEFLEKIEDFLKPRIGILGMDLSTIKSPAIIAEERRARREEEQKIIDLESQKKINEHAIKFSKKTKDNVISEINSLTLPGGVEKEFFMLFVFAILGVVFPLFFEYWSPHTGFFHPHAIALTAFLIGLLLNLIFIANEAKRVIDKKEK